MTKNNSIGNGGLTKVKDIINKYARNEEEKVWLEKVISMMMCIKKYDNLKNLYDKQRVKQ